MSQLKPLYYKNGPIRSLATLAESLKLTCPQLLKLAENSNSMYFYRPQEKKDGSLRDTWDAHPQLKSVHELLNKRFLKKIDYPNYLQGGIRHRDYVRNVSIHSGAKCAIALDVADFFPSITETQVYDIWHKFFRFSEEVSKVLTKLTTYKGILPQGAKTSSYLANLVLWREESNFVFKLQSLGWGYSRLIDDITISKKNVPKSNEVSHICGMGIHFIESQGFKLKRSKLVILRQEQQMKLNGILANVRPALMKAERNKIRGQVKWLSRSIDLKTPILSKQLHSTIGKLEKLRRFHPREASKLRETLPNKIEQSANLIEA